MKVAQYKPICVSQSNHRLTNFKEREIETPDNLILDNPEKIYELMTSESIAIQKNSVEYLYMLCLNRQLKLISLYEVSKGTIDSHLISPRDIIINAALSNSCGIILIHNHPSGTALPSGSDIENTKSVSKALEICDMALIDHIIIGRGEYCSICIDENHVIDYN